MVATSARATQLNILVVKGSDFNLPIYYYEGDKTTIVEVASVAGDSVAKLTPPCEDIPSGAILDFIGICGDKPYRAITSAIAASGADAGQRYRSFSILSNVLFPLPKETAVQFPPDLSGRTWQGQVRSGQVASGEWGDGTLVYTLADINLDTGTTATRGLIQIDIPRATTADFDVTLTPAILGSQSIESWAERSLPRVAYGDTNHYTYSIEEVVGTKRYQRVYGALVVMADSTVV